jgi:hypothetical protein
MGNTCLRDTELQPGKKTNDDTASKLVLFRIYVEVGGDDNPLKSWRHLGHLVKHGPPIFEITKSQLQRVVTLMPRIDFNELVPRWSSCVSNKDNPDTYIYPRRNGGSPEKLRIALFVTRFSELARVPALGHAILDRAIQLGIDVNLCSQFGPRQYERKHMNAGQCLPALWDAVTNILYATTLGDKRECLELVFRLLALGNDRVLGFIGYGQYQDGLLVNVLNIMGMEPRKEATFLWLRLVERVCLPEFTRDDGSGCPLPLHVSHHSNPDVERHLNAVRTRINLYAQQLYSHIHKATSHILYPDLVRLLVPCLVITYHDQQQL